jgi:hypothetical protein
VTDQVHDRPTDQTIQEAAIVLGISPNAVRMRIRRGTLSGYKADDGRWYVHRTVHETDQVHGPTDQATSAPHRVTPTEIEQAVERTAAIYTADVSNMFNRIDAIYRDRLNEKDELIVELRRRAEQAEQERDALRVQQIAQAAPGATEPNDQHEDEETPAWWQFWRRD